MIRTFVVCLCWILFISSNLFSASSNRKRIQDSAVGYCGTYPGRLQDELRKSQDLRTLAAARKRKLGLPQRLGATRDVGQIAVVEDDGSIILPNNPFDLTNTVLHVAPAGLASYTLTRQSGTLNTNLGSSLSLTDDAAQQMSFQGGFQFPFFGSSYSSVFVNSDGNITFGQGDTASTERGVTRFNSGPPRISGFFADLNPETSPGAVYFNQLSDRVVITWNRIREYGSSREGSFQIALLLDGSFELAYGSVNVSSGIVGWAAGGAASAINVVDLISASGALSGTQMERFTRLNQNEVDVTALARKFYETHGDEYQQLVVFTNFPYNLDDAFAYELNVKNSIQGINLNIFDDSAEFGSQGALESFLAMNELAEFPDDLDAPAVRGYSPIQVLAHETAHRWLAYPFFRSGAANSSALLGYQQAHWSFFFNADASLMEGHLIQDNGNGTFTISDATKRYSKLDQYLMGLRSASDVGPLFYVQPASGTGHVASDVSNPSDIGLTFSGTRRDLTVNDIMTAHGPRLPDVSVSPKTFRQAFVLLVRPGTSPSAAELEKIERIRRRWTEFFAQATEGRANAVTTINTNAVLPVISSVVPKWGSTFGDTQIYVSGSNFQPGAKVQVGGVEASQVNVLSASLIAARTPAGAEGAATVTVSNTDGSADTLSNAFAYRQLSAVTVASNALRIPYVVDNLSFRSNLGINNPSSSPASVRISLLDNRGMLVNRLESVVVPPRGYVQKNSVLQELEGSGHTTGREGSLVLESDQPIQAFVSQIDAASGDPSILEGIRQGSSRLVLQSAANSGPFRSNLVVLNLSSSEALVDVTPLDRNSGQPIGTGLRNVAIGGNGFIRYDNALESVGVTNNYGPLEIRSTNGTLLAAVSQVSGINRNTSGFFEAQRSDSSAETLIVPYVVEDQSFRTNLGLNNLGDRLSTVNVELIGTDGKSAALPVAVQIAPQGLLQINRIVSYLSANSASVPTARGYLRITADQPLLAFASQIDNASDDPSISTGVSSGSRSLLLQASANTNFHSSLFVVNPNDSAVEVTLIAREGSATNNGAVTATSTKQVPANGLIVIENLLQELGASSSFGPVEIRCALPVIAVSRVYNPDGNTSGFLEAKALP